MRFTPHILSHGVGCLVALWLDCLKSLGHRLLSCLLLQVASTRSSSLRWSLCRRCLAGRSQQHPSCYMCWPSTSLQHAQLLSTVSILRARPWSWRLSFQVTNQLSFSLSAPYGRSNQISPYSQCLGSADSCLFSPRSCQHLSVTFKADSNTQKHA